MNNIALYLMTALFAAGGPLAEVEPPARLTPDDAEICVEAEADQTPTTPLEAHAPVASLAAAQPWCMLCDLDGDPFYCCMCEENDLEYCAVNS